MTLRPTAAPAQQLMSMYWSEQQPHPQPGRITHSTYRLIHLALVETSPDGLTVTLTPAGREEAQRLIRTPAGQEYMRHAEEPRT
ncbi:hypothetical protein IHN63_00030 [Deinococcus sp. 6YEL10]|uniref:hypothetical protein n=1 Tax=Deinococcus sp. 6YEL10 TaxID=2745870 RepID=UPI001E64EE45|nr:hypothetical protein [Deinococcus sp. 6YEL10]MCD0159685.1 hypothetical protein [Deinococcus sp. 6YEL10]